MKKTCLFLAILLSTQAEALTITHGHLIDHKQTIVGASGYTTELPIKKKFGLSSANADANVSSVEGEINMAYQVEGFFNYSIVNSDDESHLYEIETKTYTEDNKSIDDVYHISLDPHGTASDSTTETLTVMYEKTGVWEDYAEIWVRGDQEDHDKANSSIDIRN